MIRCFFLLYKVYEKRILMKSVKSDCCLNKKLILIKVLEFEPDNKEVIFCKGCSFKKAERYEKAITIFEKITDSRLILT